MASNEIEEGQFDDAPGDIQLPTGRPEAAYIDTVSDHGEAVNTQEIILNHDYPPTSDDEDEYDDDEFLEEDEYYSQTRVEDEDWEVAERDFTKQYNRLRQHVAVRTGNAQGVSSSINHKEAVAPLPAVNFPKSSAASTSAKAPKASASNKDPTINQLEAYAQKYNAKIAKLEQPYQAEMGVGVNRKGPSAHANLKDKSDRATNEQVLDPRTRLILFKMIGRGLLDEVNGCVSTGKEANVYHALTPTKDHLALKIYKTSILVFKDRSKYVTGEYRFRRGYSRNPRKMVRLWAEKEMRNLRRLRAAGIDAPEPLEVRENVLVMSFVGNEGWASPRLKDTELTPEQLTPLYLQLVLTVRKIFHVCKLVHADLSEYNILYHNGALWIIDVSQSVEHDHPAAFDFLRTDLQNVEEFFGRGGVSTLGLRRTFEFVTRENLCGEGESEETVLERWIEEREAAGDEKEETGEGVDVVAKDRVKGDEAHEDSIFMKSFIPRNLNEVYDPERDVEKVTRGEGKNLIYADTIGVVAPEDDGPKPKPKPAKKEGKGVTFGQEKVAPAETGTLESEDESEDGGEAEEDEDGEKEFVERKPKGHKFEDKDVKKERKKAAKEEAREKRKTKMPKAEKKKLVKKSART
ncbi:atypical/RIO/RIO1 protein kinase [Ephemerocybe angulata]|uniref:Serine/threonine-protein kinase RIO1 n=1 Tax=Ephemerocybe angulata TaxID=980116 RepID=A0A8H6I1V8_9AGAR|nr:atypical/RIO/RIO1 protein kinase [Tulosesus angulatus]